MTDTAVTTAAPVSTFFTPEENLSAVMARVREEAGITTETEEEVGESTTEETPVEDDTKDKGKPEPKEPKEPKEAVITATVDELSKLAKEGDLEGILKKLGVDPNGVKIPSHRFAEFRKFTAKEKDAIARERAAVEARKAEVQRTIDEVVKEHEPFARARQLHDKGDPLGALEAAFGKEYGKVLEEALAQQAGKDPELIALKRREEKRERDEQARQQAEQERRAAAERAQQETQYIQRLGEELAEDEDPVIAQAATKRPDFVTAVFRAQAARYDNGKGPLLTPTEAAKEVIEVIRKAHLSWAEVFGPAGGGQSAANTARAGTSPSNTDPAGRSPEKKARKGVSRAPITPHKAVEQMTDEEARRFFASQWDSED